MTVAFNLIPGQYQIEDQVMGKGTTVRMESFDIKPDDINTQDYQTSRADEINFGSDQFKPTTIEMTFSILKNRILPQFEADYPDFWTDMPTVADFKRIWRGDGVRVNSGQITPLYVCGEDGVTRMVYGRTRQFTYPKDSEYTESLQCLAEFQRADTLSYTAQEAAIALNNNEDPVIFSRDYGDAPAWFRILGKGPITNPVINIGSAEVRIEATIAAGEYFEISSYPWQRRILSSTGEVLNANLTNAYLDKLTLPVGEEIPIRWTSDDFNTWVPYTGNQDWVVSVKDINYHDLGAQWQVMAGKPAVRFDLINRAGPRFYFGSPILGNTSAAYYKLKNFATLNQYAEAKLTEPQMYGTSGLGIMSNASMTNYAVLEVKSQLGNNQLRIRNGTGPTNWGPIQASYTLSREWFESDIVAIRYDPDAHVFEGLINGEVKLSWPDAGNLVTKSILTNNLQTMQFDMFPNMLSSGPGFRAMMAYDWKQVPVDTGEMYLLWHDAWTTIQ